MELERSVPALSIGRRCAVHGYCFTWELWDVEPTLTTPDGDTVELKVVNYVPSMLTSPGPRPIGGRRRTRCMPAVSSADVHDSP